MSGQKSAEQPWARPIHKMAGRATKKAATRSPSDQKDDEPSAAIALLTNGVKRAFN